MSDFKGFFLNLLSAFGSSNLSASAVGVQFQSSNPYRANDASVNGAWGQVISFRTKMNRHLQEVGLDPNFLPDGWEIEASWTLADGTRITTYQNVRDGVASTSVNPIYLPRYHDEHLRLSVRNFSETVSEILVTVDTDDDVEALKRSQILVTRNQRVQITRFENNEGVAAPDVGAESRPPTYRYSAHWTSSLQGQSADSDVRANIVENQLRYFKTIPCATARRELNMKWCSLFRENTYTLDPFKTQIRDPNSGEISTYDFNSPQSMTLNDDNLRKLQSTLDYVKQRGSFVSDSAFIAELFQDAGAQYEKAKIEELRRYINNLENFIESFKFYLEKKPQMPEQPLKAAEEASVGSGSGPSSRQKSLEVDQRAAEPADIEALPDSIYSRPEQQPRSKCGCWRRWRRAPGESAANEHKSA